jgi:hypothetical protein
MKILKLLINCYSKLRRPMIPYKWFHLITILRHMNRIQLMMLRSKMYIIYYNIDRNHLDHKILLDRFQHKFQKWSIYMEHSNQYNHWCHHQCKNYRKMDSFHNNSLILKHIQYYWNHCYYKDMCLMDSHQYIRINTIFCLKRMVAYK